MSAVTRQLERHFVVADATAGVVLTAVAAALVVAIGARLFHIFFGDPTIYLPYARNISHGDFFSYNPGHFSSGSTGPLWAVVLALPYVLGAGVTGAKVTAVAVTAASVAGTAFAAQRVAGSRAAAGAAAFLAVGAASLFGVLLYESGLVAGVVALSIVAVARRVDSPDVVSRRDRVVRDAPLVLAWAVLPLARPDAAVIVCLEAIIVAVLARRRRRDVRAVVFMLVIAAVPAAAYYGYSQATLGVYSVSAVARAFALSETRGSLYHLGGLRYSRPAYDYVAQNVALVVTAALGFAYAIARRRDAWFGILGLAAFAAYAVMLVLVQPVTADADRYFVPVVPLACVGIAVWTVAVFREPRWTTPVLLAPVAAAELARPAFGAHFALANLAVLVVAAVVASVGSPAARYGGTGIAILLVAYRYHADWAVLRVPHWYVAPAIAALVVAVGAMAMRPDSLAVVGAGIAALVVAGGAVSTSVDSTWQRARSLSTLPYPFDTIVERQLAERINRTAPRDASILAYEVQDRYFLRPDLDLVSLDGITDGRVIPYMKRHDVLGFLRRYKPQLWVANEAAATRPYLVGSVLDTAYQRLLHGAGHAQVAGIGFRVVARRAEPDVPGFAGWQMLVRLHYGGGS